ncbi:RT0821/Lpp0805 family surface protein [Afifella pfennigii]|uniref:RT0821/Lpp0805 family surface protein n=1 Tax=Afifella pfennigii TaxID=209897 RepID=UPI000554F48B|nr:RT0821/Lpp0805 family surface protein [Afifella pfennigii]
MFVALPLSACSMVSMPFSGKTETAAITTGSIAPAVLVHEPLPEALSYSDAARIGQTAGLAGLDEMPKDGIDWINEVTGSAGVVRPLSSPVAKDARTCRDIEATVTSIGGVHRYGGTLCEDARTGQMEIEATGSAS